MENYSDGLEFLIKSRICIAEEFELKNVNSDLSQRPSQSVTYQTEL